MPRLHSILIKFGFWLSRIKTLVSVKISRKEAIPSSERNSACPSNYASLSMFMKITFLVVLKNVNILHVNCSNILMAGAVEPWAT
jgi:hypothetical protein